MATIILSVNKEAIWQEVAKATNYSGDKTTEADDKAYDRIVITDEDTKSLQRFWDEAVAVANEHLEEMLITYSNSTEYKATLNVSSMYNTALNSSVEKALLSYFVAGIVGRWYKFANKSEASEFLTDSAAMLELVKRKLYSRKAPTRPNRQTH